MEDDPDLGQVIGEIFSRENITVRVAHTRQSAMDECLTFQPHLIVLNIGMPDGDGFNVVDWLRQHEDLNHATAGGLFCPWIDPGRADAAGSWIEPLPRKSQLEPEQLEALVLTMLRSSQEIEEAALPEVSAGQGS